MKIIKNNVYFTKFKIGTTSWEENKYIKADSIVEVVSIINEYAKNKYKGQDVTILEIKVMGMVLEASTKTITVEV